MSDKPATEAKDKLRREMPMRLKEMGADRRAEASLVICQMAANLPAFIRARCVGLFAPLPSEPDIHPLIEEAWAQGKRVALPLMIKGGSEPVLNWHEIESWENVVPLGQPGLREPDPLRCPRVALAELDCVFIPGVAFDRAGFRLGRGRGFYDRFLSLRPANLTCLGLMFGLQEVPLVPRDIHDQALRGVITEDGERSFA